MSEKAGASSSSPGLSRSNSNEFKEFSFRLPQNQRKKYSVMQFNRGDNVDLTKWQQAKMERENNKIHYKTDLDDLPKFGAGSEFGRERREEARQKKYGIVTQKYREEDQPWIMRQCGHDGKTAKKYRGRKEGRINENSDYFILAQVDGDGTFEAYPVDSWYNFTAMQNYKTLNAEEAEEEFGRRDKTMNYFSVMVQKKLRDEKDEDEKEEKTTKSRQSELTLMEDDYFLDSDEDDDSDDDKRGKAKKGKSKKKGEGKKRPKKKDLDSEAEEESDEGDFDGRELDYISESSSNDDEVELAKTDIKGLDQELQQMEEEEEEKEGEEDEEEEKGEKEGAKEEKSKEKKEAKSSDSSSDSSDSDSDIDEKNIQSAMLLQKKNTKKGNEKTPSKSGSGSRSRSQTPTVPESSNGATDKTLTDAAQKLENSAAKKRPNPSEQPATKRPRTESPVPAAGKTPSGHVPLTEEEVRRYLMRRPMTTKDLLVKLNPKRTGLPKEQIETKLAEILVKLAPEKRKKDNKIYWFIREHSK